MTNRSDKGATPTGFLSRLRRDARGNVMAITAASIVPLIGMIGGAVDISRVYLTRTRLQQACDAGALAGRKSMTGITWTTIAANGDTSSEATAGKFFNSNFGDSRYGTKNKAYSFTASNTGAVTGTASVVVPMTLMAFFAMPDRTVGVSCTANLQLPNTDVMFVLDTTLSMNDPLDGVSKIITLRSAVANFYAQLEAVKAAGSQIRYGFVPYSSTVNVGMLLQRDWIQDNPSYDSRVPDGTSSYTSNPTGSTMNNNDPWQTVSGSYGAGPITYGLAENCVAPANTLSDTSTYTAWTPSSSAVPRERTRTRTRNGTSYSATLTSGVCKITSTVYNNLIETQVERIVENPNAGQTTTSTIYHWIYRPVNYSMANLKGTGAGSGLVTGGSFTAPVTNDYAKNDITPNSVSPRTITWNAASGACIEERATRRTNETILTSRHDMNVDLIPDPSDADTQWKPLLPGVIYGRVGGSSTATTGWVFSGSLWSYTRVLSPNSTSNYYTPNGDTTKYAACPTKALKMAAIPRTNTAPAAPASSVLTAYLNSLTPAGYTYHDIGMLWGLRLISRDGIFGTENRAAEATGNISRNIIFMTDGDTDTRIQAYDAWGLSAVARRRTSSASIPTNADQNAVTEARLTELCNVAKNDKKITVWVIAFGTTLTTLLSNCASPGRAYQANNAAELATTFSQIASQIAQLRLTQ